MLFTLQFSLFLSLSIFYNILVLPLFLGSHEIFFAASDNIARHLKQNENRDQNI